MKRGNRAGDQPWLARIIKDTRRVIVHILFFSDHFKPETNAPASHVYERAKLWVEAGHQVTVITSAPNAPTGYVYPGYQNAWRSVEIMDGIRVVRVKTYIAENKGSIKRSLDYASYGLTAFANALLERKPDIVISTSPQLFVPVAGLLYARLRGLSHVFELRDLWPASIAATTGVSRSSFAYRALEMLEMALYRHSDSIIAFTEAFRDDLASRGIRRDKISVIINGTNLSLFNPRPPAAEIIEELDLQGRFVIGYIGTLGLAHGLENVVDAAEMLAHTNATFLFVGEGAAKSELVAQVRSRGLHNIVFVPRQPKERTPLYWSVCNAALVHLRNDPVFSSVIPSKSFEAMAMGLPVLYSGPRGQATAILESNDCGVIADPHPRALADAVLALMQEGLRERLRYNALIAAPKYSRERQASATLKVLADAAAGIRSSDLAHFANT